MVDKQVKFKVILRDQVGKLCSGDHILTLHLVSASETFAECVYASPGQNKGMYVFTYTPTFPSELTLTVHVNDDVLDQFSCKLLVMNVPYPSNCFVKGLGTEQATKNTVANFEVILADKNGTPINTKQSVTASFRLVSGSLKDTDCIALPIQVVCHLASMYSVAYMPSVYGECILTVFVNGIQISEPKNVTVLNSNHSSLGGAAYHGKLTFVKSLVQQGGQSNFVSL